MGTLKNLWTWPAGNDVATRVFVRVVLISLCVVVAAAVALVVWAVLQEILG